MVKHSTLVFALGLRINHAEVLLKSHTDVGCYPEAKDVVVIPLQA